MSTQAARARPDPVMQPVRVPLAQPMAGCTVLVTADRRKSELAAALQRRGAQIRHAPALSMVPHADDVLLLAATRELIARLLE